MAASKELYDKITELSVKPDKYTKPIRMYMDVDGVVLPFTSYEDESRPVPALRQAEIEVFSPSYFDPTLKKMRISYSGFAAQKLSEWSHRDDVDFVWLTSWRVNAPYSLDGLLNVNSVGFLPWELKMSDYNGSFKRIALMEEQEEHPSDFVWVDDISNRVDRFDKPEDLFVDFSYWDEKTEQSTQKLIVPPGRYLNVTTDSYTGLTETDAEIIDNWLNNR